MFVKIVLHERRTLFNLKNNMQQMPVDGQLGEVRVAMHRLQRRSLPLRLHASPKWLREKLHSRRAVV